MLGRLCGVSIGGGAFRELVAEALWLGHWDGDGERWMKKVFFGGVGVCGVGEEWGSC